MWTEYWLSDSETRGVRGVSSLLMCAAVVTTGLLAGTPMAHAQTTTCLKEPCPRQDVAATAGTYGTIPVSSRGRGLPVQVSGVSGGPADAPEVDPAEGGPCVGFTGVTPDHVLTLAVAAPALRIAVTSLGDTSLVIHGPDGWYCVDDVEGFNPVLEGGFAAGSWRIWVASYDMAQYHEYTLNVSTSGPAAFTPATTTTTTATPPAFRPATTTPATPSTTPVVAPPVAPPPVQLVFQGRFEDLDVRFNGTTVDEVHRACTTFAGGADLDWIDDIVVNGTSARNGSSYWNASALCAIVGMNARPEGATAGNAMVQGNLEGVPFEVHGTTEQVRATLQSYLPVAVDMSWADDLMVNGQARRNSSSYWSLNEVLMQIMSLARAAP